MIFTDGEKTLKLQILGYEFPELSGKGSEYSFEANWLVLRGTYTNEDGEPIESEECMVIYIHLKRMKQMLTKKNHTS